RGLQRRVDCHDFGTRVVAHAETVIDGIARASLLGVLPKIGAHRLRRSGIALKLLPALIYYTSRHCRLRSLEFDDLDARRLREHVSARCFRRSARTFFNASESTVTFFLLSLTTRESSVSFVRAKATISSISCRERKSRCAVLMTPLVATSSPSVEPEEASSFS